MPLRPSQNHIHILTSSRPSFDYLINKNTQTEPQANFLCELARFQQIKFIVSRQTQPTPPKQETVLNRQGLVRQCRFREPTQLIFLRGSECPM
jgi:hypothetical protein